MPSRAQGGVTLAATGRCPDKEGEGPPCTAEHEDIVYLDLVFNHTGLEEGQLIQSAGATAKAGLLSYFESPWATLDSQGCDYLDTSGEWSA
jgi:hypothetical protein